MKSQRVEPVDVDALIHPDLKETFSKMPNLSFSRENVVEARNYLKAVITKLKASTTSPYDHIPTTTQHIPGPKDAPEVLVKIYNTKPDTENRPALLWMHGGGYIVGHPDDNDIFCQRVAHEVDCVVVSVDYRLAPEHPYPAAIEDCYAALVWMKDSAKELGIDIKKIAIAGQSAGGGLCAALTLMARDRNGPEICFQIPLYPMIDNRNITNSSHEIVDPKCWNRDININAWEMYLGDHAKEVISPYSAPIHAKDLSRLPPTFTFVGALDVFRDETIEYVTKLLQAKVPVEFHVYPGCFHGFDSFIPNAAISKEAKESIVNALKKAFAK